MLRIASLHALGKNGHSGFLEKTLYRKGLSKGDFSAIGLFLSATSPLAWGGSLFVLIISTTSLLPVYKGSLFILIISTTSLLPIYKGSLFTAILEKKSSKPWTCSITLKRNLQAPLASLPKNGQGASTYLRAAAFFRRGLRAFVFLAEVVFFVLRVAFLDTRFLAI